MSPSSRGRRRASGSRSRRPRPAAATALGDSVAINGCCLTAVARRRTARLAFEAVPETLSRTSLARLAAGARVNLEPCAPRR